MASSPPAAGEIHKTCSYPLINILASSSLKKKRKENRRIVYSSPPAALRLLTPRLLPRMRCVKTAAVSARSRGGRGQAQAGSQSRAGCGQRGAPASGTRGGRVRRGAAASHRCGGEAMINKRLAAGARPSKGGRGRAVPRAAGLGGVQAGLETIAHPKPLPMLSNYREASCLRIPSTAVSLLGTSSRPDNGLAGRSWEPLCPSSAKQNKSLATSIAVSFVDCGRSIRSGLSNAPGGGRGPAAHPRPLETTTA